MCSSISRAPLRGGAPVVHGNDLLPIAFTPGALAIMAANVQRVQERLGRPIGVENLAAYLGWRDADALAEPAFFNALVRRSGCWLLLDVNNLVVNALNALNARDGEGDDAAAVAACAWIDALDTGSVGEIHLAGYRDCGDIVIDDHGSRVRESVWRVYRHALRKFGPLPTLIEWDTDLPALDVLLDEAARAAGGMAELAPAGAAGST